MRLIDFQPAHETGGSDPVHEVKRKLALLTGGSPGYWPRHCDPIGRGRSRRSPSRINILRNRSRPWCARLATNYQYLVHRRPDRKLTFHDRPSSAAIDFRHYVRVRDQSARAFAICRGPMYTTKYIEHRWPKNAISMSRNVIAAIMPILVRLIISAC